MTAVETRLSQVAIVGRVADELTRQDLNPRRVRASLRNHPRQAVGKEDGYFVFADLPASPPVYEVELTGRHFQSRRLALTASAATATEIDLAGEDELQVIVTDIIGNRASFAPVPLVPTIDAGALVLGAGGFSTILGEAVEGVDVDGAELLSATGLGVGEALRIIRSSRLLMRPGPYYPFPEVTTVVALRVVENLPGHAPIADASIQITSVNGAPVTSVVIDSVTLFRAELPTGGTPPTAPFMIGTLAARATATNARGDAVFHYPRSTPVTSLVVDVSKPGYVAQAPTVTVTPGARSSARVQLVRV